MDETRFVTSPPLHILFLSDNFPPEVNPGASRTHDHARAWVEAGHRVTVITSQPNSPSGRVYAGYRNRLWQSETVSGIRVIRVWTYMTRNEGFARRILDFMSYMVAAFIAALTVRRVDVIIVTSPQFFAAVAAGAVALVKRRPWVFDVRDIWPESIRAVGAMRESRVLDALERLELLLYRSAAAITVVTHSFKKNLVTRGVPAEKIHVVTNGVDTSRLTPALRDAALNAQLSLEDKFVVGYIGTHGMAHGLDTVLDAAKLLAGRADGARYRFILQGDGAERAQLKARAAREGIDNVLFLEPVLKNEIGRYWSLLDAALIPLRRTPLFQTVIPSKLFECMAMGLPVLHGVEGESARIVTENAVGLAIEPENAAALADAIVQLANDPELRARFARNGPMAARLYDRDTLALAQLDILSAVATTPRRSI